MHIFTSRGLKVMAQPSRAKTSMPGAAVGKNGDTVNISKLDRVWELSRTG